MDKWKITLVVLVWIVILLIFISICFSIYMASKDSNTVLDLVRGLNGLS